MIRQAIEDSVKNLRIDRRCFYEVAKIQYAGIIEQITDTFVDKSQKWHKGIHWANMGQYKKNLFVHYEFEKTSRIVDLLSQIVPSCTEKVWFLVEGTHKYWLYEGQLQQICNVLNDTCYYDFYIVSKKFDWLISENHHDVWSFVGSALDLSVFMK